MHPHLLPVVALSLVAALAFAVSSSLKHVSAGRVPDAQDMHPGKLIRFVRATLSHPLWLAGIGCDLVGLVAQVLALHLGELAVVQTLLVSGLLFALVLNGSHRSSRYRLTARQFGWAAALVASLAGFLFLATRAHGQAQHEPVDKLPAVAAGVIGALLAVGCVELGRRHQHAGRSAALLGVATGILYAADAALLKALTDVAAARGLLLVIASWQLYTVLVLGAAGMILEQLALQAGPLTASLPATFAVDPLVSIAVGVSVFDERIHTGPGGVLLLVALLAVLGIAVIQLARDVAPTRSAAMTAD